MSLEVMQVAKIYICSPHRLIKKNKKIATILRADRNIVHLPHEFCENEDKIGDRKQIRRKCIDAIENSDVFIINLDDYGMDSSWELGYAEKAGKRIIGLHLDEKNNKNSNGIKPKSVKDHWMHNWEDKGWIEDLNVLKQKIQNKKVYLSIPLRNQSSFSEYEYQIKAICKKLYVPWEVLDSSTMALPKEMWYVKRNDFIELMEDADIFLMYIDDYGMDSSWELGYAEKAKKEIIGFSLDNEKLGTQKILTPQSFWNHWMHGWRNKNTIARNYDDLVLLVRSLELLKITVVCPIIEKTNLDGSTNILIQTRRNPKDPKYHDFIEIPGGKIRYQENINDALKREVKEECGLDIEPIEDNELRYQYEVLASKANVFKPYSLVEEIGDHSYIGIFKKCRVVGGELTPTDEAIDQKWISKDELKKLINEKKVLPINAPGLKKYCEE